MSARAIRDPNIIGPTMNVVMIYDQPDFAERAKTMLECAAHWTDKTPHLIVKPWQVDMLALSPPDNLALVEAAGSHLIVIAVRQVESPLMGWLELWTRCRQIQRAALALWDRGNAHSPSAQARAAPDMSRFAGRHGLTLIFDDDPLFEDISSMDSGNMPKNAPFLTPTLRHILEQPR